MSRPSATARYADLNNAGVFVSGGATGIGADLVTAFHEQGARIVFLDIDGDAGGKLADALASHGPRPDFIEGDVTDDAVIRDAIARVEAVGPLKVLINNAANDTRMPTEDVTSERFHKIVDVNLRHQLVAAQAASKGMKAQGGGAIINLGSIAPEVMVENLAVYQMCKAGVRGLTRSLARDLGQYGIRVNSILPGAVLTDRQKELWYRDQAAIDEVVNKQCLRRELSGRDVAEMALFLASDVSAGCSAQDFIVDGGMV